MNRAFRLIFIGLVLSLFGLVFLTSVRVDLGFIVVVALAAAATGLSVALLSDAAAFYSLGCAICILPVFGSGVLNLFVLGWVSGVYLLRSLFGFSSASIDLSGSREIASWAFFLLILPLLCAVGLTFYLEFDRSIVWAIYRNDGLDGLYQWIAISQVPWHRAIVVASGYIVSGLLFFAVVSIQNVTVNALWFSRGAFTGAILSIGFLLGQLQENPGWFFLNMNPFWHYVRRYPATFSDPNAFGIVAMMLIPLFLGICSISFASQDKDIWSRIKNRRGWLFGLGAVLLTWFSVWSGSRTLYLGLVLWLALVGISMLRLMKRKELQIALLASLGLFITAVALGGYPPLNERLQQSLPYPGIQRVLKTVNWNDAGEMLASRKTFSKLSYLTWQQSPLTGLGLERFQTEQARIMRSYGIDLGAWRDNANNFYLQILVEQGVLGLALFCIALGYFTFIFLSPERRVIVDVDKMEPAAERRMFSLARGILAVFAVTLITGPHTHFDEVRYLAFFLLAIAISRPIAVHPSILTIVRGTAIGLVLLFPALFYVFVSKTVERPLSEGFYGVEEGPGVPVAWSVDQARLYFCEPVGEYARIRFRALQPNIADQPLKVAFFERSPGDRGSLDLETLEPIRLTLNDNDWQEVMVPMPQRGLRSLSSLEMRVSHLWNSKRMKVGNDPRWLGLMIQWPKESC